MRHPRGGGCATSQHDGPSLAGGVFNTGQTAASEERTHVMGPTPRVGRAWRRLFSVGGGNSDEERIIVCGRQRAGRAKATVYPATGRQAMKALKDRKRCREDARPWRWGAALVMVVVAVASGAEPAFSGDVWKDMQPSATAGSVRPLDLVKSSVAQVLAVVQSRPAAEDKNGQRRAEIRRIAAELFDFNEMARLTLSRHWSAQAPREQEEFVRLFSDLLERSYLSTIENYAGERITFLGESVTGSYAQVRSRITTDRRVEISIDYRLIKRGDRWMAYDVVLEGVSLVSNYRSQFNAIVRTSSFGELMTRLRDKQIEAHVVPRVGRGS
jgi:phospholipid transport system substrate-binding protein